METKRLWLRTARASDLNEFLAIRNSEFVLKYNAMKLLTHEEAAAQIASDAASGDVFYLEAKEGGALIGAIYLEQDSLRYGVRALGTSYYLGERYAGQGYMTEALCEVMRYVFEERNADVLSARVFRGNEASTRLLVRLGFVNEGCLRRCVMGYGGVIYDDLVFSVLKEDAAVYAVRFRAAQTLC